VNVTHVSSKPCRITTRFRTVGRIDQDLDLTCIVEASQGYYLTGFTRNYVAPGYPILELQRNRYDYKYVYSTHVLLYFRVTSPSLYS
jgi:hypothetical protein